MTIWPTACATAHRKLPAEQWPWVREELRRVAVKLRDEYGTTLAWSGMAVGGDLEWAQAVAETEGLRLGACIPFREQAKGKQWSREEKERWQLLVDQATEVKVIGSLKGVPTPKRSARANQLYHGRNTAMLVMSQVLVAVLDLNRANDHSGTFSTYENARKTHKPIILIRPDRCDRTRILNSPQLTLA